MKVLVVDVGNRTAKQVARHLGSVKHEVEQIASSRRCSGGGL